MFYLNLSVPTSAPGTFAKGVMLYNRGPCAVHLHELALNQYVEFPPWTIGTPVPPLLLPVREGVPVLFREPRAVSPNSILRTTVSAEAGLKCRWIRPSRLEVLRHQAQGLAWRIRQSSVFWWLLLMTSTIATHELIRALLGGW